MPTTDIPKLINTSHLKKYALQLAGADANGKGGKFERVSGEFFAEVNSTLGALVAKHVTNLPATGKTIFGPSRRSVTWVEAPVTPAEAAAAAETATETAAAEAPEAEAPEAEVAAPEAAAAPATA